MGCWSTATMCLTALTSLVPLSLAAAPSSAPPVPGLPFEQSLFTDLIASVQNTYCGAAANNVGQVIGDQTLLYAIGNGDVAQRCNIYHSTSLGIIVAYEGTNASSLISILHDVDAVQSPPNPVLGLPPTCLVDLGFQNAWFTTWPAVSNALTAVVAEYPNDSIVVTGHSLGAAQALLGAVAVNQQFPGKISNVITFGGPRVGNPAFADAFDARFNGSFTGVVNGRDWVPSVPFVNMGYWHPSGLVWINPANSTSWEFYPGQENTNFMSAYSPLYFYPNTTTLDFDDHQGIYMHSSMGTTQGPCPAKVGGY